MNGAGMTVWVEEARVVLTDLDATWQTAIPSGHAKHEIRQNVRANESLGLSMAGASMMLRGGQRGDTHASSLSLFAVASAKSGLTKFLIHIRWK